MADKGPVSSELSRDLSLFHITMMGLGMMIGAGVFIGIGISLGEAGPGGLVLSFALNGLIALFTAMSFAELSSAIPRAGGAYNFARVGFGRGTSFVAGWMEWFASSVAGSLYAVVFATYTLHFLGELGLLGWLPFPLVYAKRGVAFAVACFFVYINYRGASETGKVGALFTIGQMVFVVGIAVVGIIVAVAEPSRLANFQPFMPRGWTRLLVTMGFIYVAFEGFEVIAQAGDETIDPKRNIPKAMIYSVFIVTMVYVAVSFATVVAVKSGSDITEPWRWIGSHGDRGFGMAVAKLLPGTFLGHLLVTLAVIFSSTSALNATIYSATRASYALGRDRMLPAAFSAISRKTKTPVVALAFTSIIVVMVAVFLPTKDVASSASIMFLFLFFLVNLCAIKIRLNMGDELEYGFVMPLFPLPPLLAVAAQLALAVWLVHMSFIAWILAPLWVFSGMAIYRFYSRSRTVATADEIHVLEEERAPAGDEYRVMVAVANPRNALELVLNAQKLCGAKQARVELLHMVPVPDQVPLRDAERFMLEGKEAMVEAMLYLAPRFPLSSTLRYCRNVARGIVSAVREKRTDMLIMGWHGQPRARAFSLGSTVDPIIERSPCNVVVLKGCGNRKFRRVLVPLAGGPNGAFALEVASILADPDEGQVVAFTVAGHSKFDVGGFLAEHVGRLHLPPERVEAKVVSAPGVVQAILREAETYDLIVIGCTAQPLLRQFTRSPVPERVARECTKPLAMVKAAAGIRSWVKRWV
ncbi:MAG TPA: amino acid permease [Planctomycetota bacterium]|nr:amino acid permease [Planctomycetota bacterium]